MLFFLRNLPLLRKDPSLESFVMLSKIALQLLAFVRGSISISTEFSRCDFFSQSYESAMTEAQIKMKAMSRSG
jgi:hypothetical protein